MGYPAGCAMVYHAERTKAHPKYLIRCAGEDIQTDKNIKYGARLDPKVDKIVRYYLPKPQKWWQSQTVFITNMFPLACRWRTFIRFLTASN